MKYLTRKEIKDLEKKGIHPLHDDFPWHRVRPERGGGYMAGKPTEAHKRAANAFNDHIRRGGKVHTNKKPLKFY